MKKVVKNKKLIAIMAVGLLALLLAASGVIASPPAGADDPPVESKINYQGQLTDSDGNPLDGTYDMEFQFWDSVSGGSQVGSTITKNNVQVDNGLFSVKLEVDQSDFNGQGLWLQMRVRPSGGSWDPWMTPRQEILPVPYALSLKPGAEIKGEGSPGSAVLSVTNSGSGYGVYGEASTTGDVQNYGGYFVAEGSRGRGVYGKAANTGDAINYGGFFYAAGTEGRGVFGQSAGSDGIGVKGWASNDEDVENYGGHFTASGNRGIGVYGEGSSQGVYGKSNYGSGVYGESSWISGWGVYGKASYLGPEFPPKPQCGGYFVAEGLHAIGVRGEAPNKHSVENYGGWFEAEGEYGAGVYARGRRGVRAYGEDTGVYATAAGSEGTGVYGRASDDGDVENYGGHFTASGSRGIGVYGKAENTAGSEPRCGGYFVAEGSEGKGVFGWASDWGEDTSNTGVYGRADGRHGTAVWAFATGWEGVGVHAVASGTGTGIYARGGLFGGYAADFQGKVIIRESISGDPVVELGEGLDYAEGFDVSDKKDIFPGSVLIIDPDNPGKLTLSDKPYDSKVAGIVAGAKEFGSGVRLGPDQFDYDVALAGRVYCNVDATEAGVEPGDLLTTSATPGYAMKVTDYDRAQGAILGKAMERLEKGEKGQILVLVTLQ